MSTRPSCGGGIYIGLKRAVIALTFPISTPIFPTSTPVIPDLYPPSFPRKRESRGLRTRTGTPARPLVSRTMPVHIQAPPRFRAFRFGEEGRPERTDRMRLYGDAEQSQPRQPPQSGMRLVGWAQKYLRRPDGAMLFQHPQENHGEIAVIFRDYAGGLHGGVESAFQVVG